MQTFIQLTNQCTRIAMQRLITIGWACDGMLALKVVSLARNRVISSVILLTEVKMGNEVYHYFGAYLEIKVNKADHSEQVLQCENGHEAPSVSSRFCNQCGKPVSEKQIITSKYPTWIVDEILGEEWEDYLSVITPRKLYGTGLIIAIGNSIQSEESWLHLDRFDDSVATKEFPTQDEILTMMNNLKTFYADIIAALRESSVVSDLQIRAGYIRNEEY